MRKNNLSSKGLSLSQAQSVANICYQQACEIVNQLSQVNNASKSVVIDKHKVYTVQAKPLPENTVQLVQLKAELHACQAFLMENIKAKDYILSEIKHASADISGLERPELPEAIAVKTIPVVTEEFGWESLTASELNKYRTAEAYAAHVGQFIHKDSKLAKLRVELVTLPSVEWIRVKDTEQTPITIEAHHTAEQLYALYEKLAELHRNYEQEVNYYKAKVKNLTTNENARIAKLNADARNEANVYYDKAMVEFAAKKSEYFNKIASIQAEFEKERQAEIKEVAALRIEVDSRFKETIDSILNKLPESEE